MKKWKRFASAALCLSMAVSGMSMLPITAEDTAAQRTAVLKPDANGDDSFDILDVINLTKYLHMKADLARPELCDLDGDGDVNVFDLALMMRVLVGLPIASQQTPVIQYAAKNLSQDYAPSGVETVALSEDVRLGQTAFSLNLLRSAMEEGENVLVSPYSVSQALGMTANGARGETREQMEAVLGGSMDALNPAFFTMRVSPETNVPSYAEGMVKRSTANSIWFKNDFPVLPEFLQTNADYYAADAFSAPMDDSTLEDVNNWVDENTDHMIPSILPQMPEDTAMILVNAVAFDAKWADPYEENSIRTGEFTRSDGKVQEVQMMHDSSDKVCLKDDHAIGFRNYYAGGQYYFAALLPEAGMTPEAYLESLTPEGLLNVLKPTEWIVDYHEMPAFTYDFDCSLAEPLQGMGMEKAFQPDADFTGMYDVTQVSPDYGLCIGDVLHKTHIEVNSGGTRAGAATAVIMTECATEKPTRETYQVILDRPFVYVIADSQTDLPLFIGTVNSVENPAE